MRAAGLTDVGCKRSMNQDAFFLDPDSQLYIVADGMGGHKAGDLASKMALEFICQFINEIEAEDFGELPENKALKREEERCRKAVQHANRSIFQKANESMDFHGMGTTVVLLKITHGHAILAHVGDSRIYRIQLQIKSRGLNGLLFLTSEFGKAIGKCICDSEVHLST